jgi:translation initiation factor 2B subunit (eIF-2B alpha/beta/delta family)
MAPLWNICAAAVAEFGDAGRFAQRRREFDRAPRALVRAATTALAAALGDGDARLLTVSHSGSVRQTIVSLAADSRRTLSVVCAESVPGREGAGLYEQLRAAGIDADLVSDTRMTTYLPSASAVVVGADGVATRHWTNKVGTYGLAAAAWFSGVPVYVVASRDKAEAAELTERLSLPSLFERSPSQLATLYLTDVGPLTAGDLPSFSERFRSDLPFLFDVL